MLKGLRALGSVAGLRTSGGFNPASLFVFGEQGLWLDPSDITTLFQDSAGTTPVTAAGQSVGLIKDKSGRGNHAIQATGALRPTYVVNSGIAGIQFNGSTQFIQTGTITPGTDKAQLFAGLRKLSDAARGTAFILFAAGGRLNLDAPSAALNNYTAVAGGSAVQGATSGVITSPHIDVVSIADDITTSNLVLRVNGAQVASNATSQGTGNFPAATMTIGSNTAGANPFNGILTSLIVRFGPNMAADRVVTVERYVNSKTLAY